MHKSIDKILAQLMASHGLNQAALSRGSGVPQPTISRILKPLGPKGIKSPTDEQVYKLAEYFGITTDQLRGRSPLSGETLEPPSEVSDTNCNVVADFSKKSREGEIDIPHYDVCAAMGDGQVPPSDYIETIKHVTVSLEYLRAQGVSYSKPGNLGMITGFGESMSKTFTSGDPLIVDKGITSVVTDGVYFYTLNGALFVKRLQILPNGIRVLSDNDAYPPYEITGKDLSGLIIHARVLLAWRSQRL